MSIEAIITFFLAIFIFSITPGPGVFALISNSLTNGIKTSVYMSIGMTISDIVYLVLAFFGLVSIATNYAFVFDFIRIAGGLYLIYLGYKIFTAPIKNELEKIEKTKDSFFKNFTKGFLISASNPKVIIFYIAFLPTFVDLTNLQTNDMFIITTLAFIALMAGLVLISYSAFRAKQVLKSEESTRNLNRSAGSIMALAGSYLIIK